MKRNIQLENSQIDTNTTSYYDLDMPDFDLNEDTIVIEVDRKGASSDRDVSIQFHQTQWNGEYTSYIKMIAEETDDTSKTITYFRLHTNVPITQDDIQFIGV